VSPGTISRLNQPTPDSVLSARELEVLQLIANAGRAHPGDGCAECLNPLQPAVNQQGHSWA
jgi:hypothetical protein